MTTPRLLDQVRAAIRVRHYGIRTEDAYLHWIRRFILFHRKRHPRELEEAAVAAFLSELATVGQVSPATQNQALNALVFLYRTVLERPLGDLAGIVRAKRRQRLPVVLTVSEVGRLLASLREPVWLVGLPAVRLGSALAGERSSAGEGSRSAAARDPRARSQGRQGPGGDPGRRARVAAGTSSRRSPGDACRCGEYGTEALGKRHRDGTARLTPALALPTTAAVAGRGVKPGKPLSSSPALPRRSRRARVR